MLHHKEQNSCKRNRTEYEAPIYPGPPNDKVLDAESDCLPPPVDNDATHYPESLIYAYLSEPPILPKFATYSISHHKLLWDRAWEEFIIEQISNLFADELIKCGFGACH
jgi:hypothetical protein